MAKRWNTQHNLISWRVQLHPATDAWMQGDRFGTVTKIGGRYIHIKMDKSGRTLALVRELFEFVEA